MDIKETKETIISLSNQRDKLASDIQRLAIKKEEAEKNLKLLEEKCVDLGFDPSTLGSEIEKLEEKCTAMINDLAAKLKKVEERIKVFKD